jgi:hypothetical protein
MVRCCCYETACTAAPGSRSPLLIPLPQPSSRQVLPGYAGLENKQSAA